MYLCVFEIGKDPNEAKKYEKANCHSEEKDGEKGTVSDGKSDQRGVDQEIAHSADQYGDGVEFSGFVPKKSDDSRKSQKDQRQEERFDGEDVRSKGDPRQKDSRIHKGNQVDRHFELHFSKPDEEFDRWDGKSEKQRDQSTEREEKQDGKAHHVVHFNENRDDRSAVKNRIDVIKQSEGNRKFTDRVRFGLV